MPQLYKFEDESKNHNTYLKQHNTFYPSGDYSQESNYIPRLLDSKMYKSGYNHHYQVMYNLEQMHLDWQEIAWFTLLSFSKH